jgi:hypothetical protein
MDAAKNATARFKDMAAAEDCIGYDPATLTIVAVPQGLELRANVGRLQLLRTTADAQNALSVARGFTTQCFIGRGSGAPATWITQYWKGGAGRPGPVSPEDCIPYNHNNLTIVEVNDSSGQWWSLRDGSMWMEAYKSEPLAVRGLRVAQQHNLQCFIGRNSGPPYLLHYWR